MEKKVNIGCVSLIGELAHLGKHVYFKDMGVTICGCFTVDYDKEQFKGMPENMTSEYKTEDWDITCERCLEMTDIFDAINKDESPTPCKESGFLDPEDKKATNIPDGENDWTLGAETFSREEVFKILYTQRAMISNDIKSLRFNTSFPHLKFYNSNDVYEILENPRTPKI